MTVHSKKDYVGTSYVTRGSITVLVTGLWDWRHDIAKGFSRWHSKNVPPTPSEVEFLLGSPRVLLSD